LALEPNNQLVKGKFLLKVFSRSLPVSLTILISIILASLFAKLLNISYEMQSSISVMLTAIIGLYYLFKICHPLNVFRGILFSFMLAGFCVVIFFVPEFFEIMPLSKVSALIVFVLTLDAFFIYKLINYAITFIANKIDDSISVESNIYKVG
jgi:cation-transporting ATPase E